MSLVRTVLAAAAVGVTDDGDEADPLPAVVGRLWASLPAAGITIVVAPGPRGFHDVESRGGRELPPGLVTEATRLTQYPLLPADRRPAILETVVDSLVAAGRPTAVLAVTVADRADAAVLQNTGSSLVAAARTVGTRTVAVGVGRRVDPVAGSGAAGVGTDEPATGGVVADPVPYRSPSLDGAADGGSGDRAGPHDRAASGATTPEAAALDPAGRADALPRSDHRGDAALAHSLTVGDLAGLRAAAPGGTPVAGRSWWAPAAVIAGIAAAARLTRAVPLRLDPAHAVTVGFTSTDGPLAADRFRVAAPTGW